MKKTMAVGIAALCFGGMGGIQTRGAAPAESQPYAIELGISKNQQGQGAQESPYIDFVVQNSSKNKTGYWLSNAMDDYDFDVKFLPDDSQNAKWKELKRIVPQTPTATWKGTMSIHFRHIPVYLAPGEKFCDTFKLTAYDLSAFGDYKVSASMLLPDCRTRPCPAMDIWYSQGKRFMVETNNTCKTVKMDSNSITIRHSPKGYEVVDNPASI
jgi:hypothetical protein